MIEPDNSQKLCSHCGPRRGLQPLDCFDKDSRSKDGHRSVCKTCRRERRYATLLPSPRQTPKNRHRVKSQPKTAKAKISAFANGACLAVLFIGGFCWSTLNGSFAFLDTARIISSGDSHLIAALAASVLTLGTAVAASWSARVYRKRRVSAAIILLLIFSILQSLNLIVNLSGVKKRLVLASKQQAKEKHSKQIVTLKEMIADYNKIIERYPPVNKLGNPVVWKPQITETVKDAYGEISRLNQEIVRLEEEMIDAKPQLSWHILLAWLVLPELCMLTAILVFALRKAPEDSLQEEVLA